MVEEARKIGHSLSQVKEATTHDEFFSEVSQIAEDLSLEELVDEYNRWRSGLIKTRLRRKAEKILEERGFNRETLLPKGFIGIETIIHAGKVPYYSIEDLIVDMWKYFVPEISFPSRSTSPQILGHEESTRVMRAVDSSFAIALLRKTGLFDPVRNMERLMEEILAWREEVSREEILRRVTYFQRREEGEKMPEGKIYKDSQARGGGDPYKYSGSRFTGHLISVEHIRENDKSFFFLRLKGAGYNYLYWNPTHQIDQFAAYNDREVIYEGPITIIYTAFPPEEVEISDLPLSELYGSNPELVKQMVKIRGKESLQLATTAILYEDPLRHLATLLGLSEEATGNLIAQFIYSISTKDPEKVELESFGVRTIISLANGIELVIEVKNIIPSTIEIDKDRKIIKGKEELVDYNVADINFIYEEELVRPVKYQQRLPQLKITVNIEDRKKQNEIARLFWAVGRVVDTHRKGLIAPNIVYEPFGEHPFIYFPSPPSGSNRIKIGSLSSSP